MRRRGRIIVSNGQIAQNGTSTTKSSFCEHDPLAARQLLVEVVDQHRPAVLQEIFGLAMRLLFEFVGEMAGRPDLPVRMRVRAAHDLAAVLEDLHGADLSQAAERDRLFDPDVDDPLDVGDVHSGKRQIVTGRETHDPADAGLTLGDEQPLLDPRVWRIGLQRREIIVEDERVLVVGIASRRSRARFPRRDSRKGHV